jgi:1,4-dihydroxy-2-naphthoate octaprenyltransferase
VTRFLEALRTVPRVEAAEWAQFSLPTRCSVAARASVLLMTFTSAALGGLLALREPGFDAVLWTLALVGLLAAHATNNLINDYVDSARGVDRDNYYRARYGTHVLENGLLSRRGMLGYIVATAAVALAAGAAVVWLRGGLRLPLLLAGAFFVLFYTAASIWGLEPRGAPGGVGAVDDGWGVIRRLRHGLAGGAARHRVCARPTSVIFGKHRPGCPPTRPRGIHAAGAPRRSAGAALGDGDDHPGIPAVALVLANSGAWTLLLVLLNVPAASAP